MTRIDDRTEWLEADGLGGFASGTTVRHPDAPLSRAAADGDDAPDGPGRAGQRIRRMGGHAGRFLCAHDPAICAGRPPSRRRVANRELHERAVADLGIRHAGRHASPAGDSGRTRQRRRADHLVAHRGGWSRDAARASVSVGTRLSLDAPRKQRLPIRRGSQGRRWSRSVPTTACRTSCRRRTATTVTRRTGIGTSSTARNSSAAWMPSRISASPGEFTWPLSATGDQAIWCLRAETDAPTEVVVTRIRCRLYISRCVPPRLYGARPLRRRWIASADAYLVRRGAGRTIIAGYPWFTDWGRDTFIAVRGLCLATGRLERRARHPASNGRARSRRACCRTAFRTTARRRSSTRSTRRCGSSSRRSELLSAVDRRSTIVSRDDRERARDRDPEDRGRLRGRHALRHPDGRRRPAGARRAGRAADVDGRARRRSRDHAAHRQAGRDPGAVAERARHRRRDWIRDGASRSSEAWRSFRRALLER